VSSVKSWPFSIAEELMGYRAMEALSLAEFLSQGFLYETVVD